MRWALGELLEELSTEGAAAFAARHPAPVLVWSAPPEEGDDERAYFTVLKGGGARQTIDSLDPDRVAPSGSRVFVQAVTKRPDRAFPERIGIGRAPNVDLHLPLPSLSKYHAFITLPDQAGQPHLITDAGSTNGTWVHGERLEPRVSAELPDRATIRLGPHEMSFYTAQGLLAYLTELLATAPRS